MNINYWRNIIHLQKTAKWISWLACAGILIWNLSTALHIFTKGVLIVFGVVVIHILLMLTKRYIFAFRLAGIEIFIALLFLLVVLYPSTPYCGIDPLMDFNLAIWVWIFGGGGLATAAWICFKAAKEIKHGHGTEKLNQHNDQVLT